jgi:AcrR family transcriptional regulator
MNKSRRPGSQPEPEQAQRPGSPPEPEQARRPEQAQGPARGQRPGTGPGPQPRPGRGRGRPSEPSQAREQILEAARRLFLASGYTRVTMRAIAVEAGVDAALISYYFGSKRGLLAAVMQLIVSPPDMMRSSMGGDPAHLAERILSRMLATWDDPETGAPLLALFRSIGSDPDANRLVREMIERETVSVIAEHLGGVDATARASVAASQIAGLIFMRYLLRAEPLASMRRSELVARAAPALRAALSPQRLSHLPPG